MSDYIPTVPGLAAFVVVAMFGVAEAASYGALDEVPAGGGELRLAQPEDHPQDDGRTAIAFPLKRTSVSAMVEGPMIQVEVEQEFENPFDDPIEAVYVFPMAHDAAVNGYEIIIGERVVEGRIAEREEARRTYEAARDAGHTAGLLEQQKANVFVQSIANIAPRETVVVRFRYVELLQYDQETGYEWAFPMTITPRYLPENSSDRRSVGGSGGSRGGVNVPYTDDSGHRVDIDVALSAGVPLLEVSSPSHEVDQRIEDSEARVSLTEEARPDRDFVLRFVTAGERSIVGFMAHRDPELGGYFTLLVQPKRSFTQGDVTPKEVIVLIDVSGSMQGQPIARAKLAARTILRNLLSHDTFNIITFASRADQYTTDPVPATESNIADALGYVDALTAGGGTELNAGIEVALGAPTTDERVRMV